MTTVPNFIGRSALAVSVVVTLGLAPAAFANETVALKNALYGAGYKVSNVSPQMDDSTRSALTEFQTKAGLQATGTLNEDTKKALGMVSVQVAAATAPASPSASQVPASGSLAAVETKAEEDGAIEEDEEGGWSLW